MSTLSSEEGIAMDMLYSQHDIAVMYKQAKNKHDQISILADLTESDKETILEILKDEGVLVEITKICPKCGKKFKTLNVRSVAVCPDCKSQRSRLKVLMNTQEMILHDLDEMQDRSLELGEVVNKAASAQRELKLLAVQILSKTRERAAVQQEIDKLSRQV